MTVKILLSITALALSVCASAKIDYADYKKLQDAYQISAPEAEKLSESGNPYAKLRSALDNIPYEREKSVSEIRELYEKRGLRLAGYYLSNFLKDKAEREKLLEKLAAEGDDYASSAAKCDLLFDNLKASLDAADAKKFNAAFDSLLSLAKGGFQPAAVKLAFFIETNCGKIKNFRDAAAELPALYGILSRASKEGEFYQMKRGEALAKRGDWKGAMEILKPIAEKFLAREKFSAAQSLARFTSGNFYGEAKSAALVAHAYREGLGTEANPDKAELLQGKIRSLKNPHFCLSFESTFALTYGNKRMFVADSPKEAAMYANMAREFENSATDRLREYNASIKEKIKKAYNKSLEELKNSSDDIEKVVYAKKLLGLQTLFAFDYLIGRYDKQKAKDALSILERLSAESNAYASLALAELYSGGNSENASFKVVNMPVDFSAQKARLYALEAVRQSVEAAWTAQALRILGDLFLLKTSLPKYFPLDGFTVKTDSADSALKMYHAAACLGDTKSLLRLAQIYEGIPISHKKYLIEPNERAAFAYKMESLDLGNMEKAGEVILSLYFGSGVKQNIPLAKKYLLKFLRSGGSENGILCELAAIMAERGELYGYPPEKAESIREKIDKYTWSHAILSFYNLGKFKSEDGLKYWRNSASEIEPRPIKAREEFAEYFASLPQTTENRFLRAICSYNPLDMQNSANKYSARGDLLKLADAGYPDAVKIMSSNPIPIILNAPDKYKQSAKNLNLPIEVSSDADAEYNMRMYAKTGDDGFLYKVSNAHIPTDFILDSLSKHSKNANFSIPLAIAKLLKAQEKSAGEFDEAVSLLNGISKMPKIKKLAFAVLSYAYSGAIKGRGNPILCSAYAKSAAGITQDIYISPDSLIGSATANPEAKKKLALYLNTIFPSNPYDVHNFENNPLEDLRNAHKLNPENEALSYALAKSELKNKNYKDAFKLFETLHKNSPEDLNYFAALGDMHYYGLGVKSDKAKGLKYYGKLFESLGGDSFNSEQAYFIVINSISSGNYVNFYKPNIPPDFIIKNIGKIPLNRKDGSYFELLNFLEKHAYTSLRDAIENKLIASGNANAIAHKALRLLRKKKPETDKQAFKLICKIHKSGLGSTYLGGLYFNGRGTQKDYKKAIELFECALKENPGNINTSACAWLALMHKEGLGVEKSEEASLKYIDLLSKSPNFAQDAYPLALQMIYGSGYLSDSQGMPKCPELGVELLKRSASAAANEGFLTPIILYAQICEDGKFAKRNLQKALELYEMSIASYKSGRPSNEVSTVYLNAARLLKLSGTAEDQKKAANLTFKWLELFPNNIDAKTDAALLYISGIGVEKNPEKAKEYLESAICAAKGDNKVLWRAYGILAYCHMKGIFGERNDKKLDEILSLIRKIPVDKNTLRHPFLFYAQWFNPHAKSGVLRACKDPVLPKDEKISLFWLGQLEALADTQTNPICALRIYEDIRSFFDPKNGFDNPRKLEAVEAKLQRARTNAAKRAKK